MRTEHRGRIVRIQNLTHCVSVGWQHDWIIVIRQPALQAHRMLQCRIPQACALKKGQDQYVQLRAALQRLYALLILKVPHLIIRRRCPPRYASGQHHP